MFRMAGVTGFEGCGSLFPTTNRSIRIFLNTIPQVCAMRKLESILLVDDDPTSLFIAKNIVKRHQVAERIFAAHSGVEAIQLLRSACGKGQDSIICPTLVMVDVRMPDMDGFQFVEAMRALTAPIVPVVAMLSSHDYDRDKKKAKHLGIEAFLQKPLTGESFREFLLSAGLTSGIK